MSAIDAWYLICALWGMLAAWAVVKGLSND
jgi:hypothetical protein